jgi:hypothetical protein
VEKLPRLPDINEPDDVPKRVSERPTLIKIYIGLSVLGFLIVLVFAFTSFDTVLRMAGTGRLSPSSGRLIQPIFIGIFAVVGLLGFFFLRGLWNLRNWARLVAIGLQSLSVLSGISSVLGASNRVASGSFQCGQFIGLALSAYFVYWFLSHGDVFN